MKNVFFNIVHYFVRKKVYLLHSLEPTDKEETANIILGNINIINFKNLSLSFYHSTKGHTFAYLLVLALLYKVCPVDN